MLGMRWWLQALGWYVSAMPGRSLYKMQHERVHIVQIWLLPEQRGVQEVHWHTQRLCGVRRAVQVQPMCNWRKYVLGLQRRQVQEMHRYSELVWQVQQPEQVRCMLARRFSFEWQYLYSALSRGSWLDARRRSATVHLRSNNSLLEREIRWWSYQMPNLLRTPSKLRFMWKSYISRRIRRCL